MAPSSTPSTLVFDFRTQVIDNCEFIINEDDSVEVVIKKDPAARLFEACAIKCSRDTREVILVSEPCTDAQKAIDSLLTKSCEALYNYTTTNGYSAPRDLKTDALEPSMDDDDDDDTASVISAHSDSSTAAISEWGSSGDEAMMPHGVPGPNGVHKERQHLAGRPRNRSTSAAAGDHEPVGRSRSRAAVRSSPDHASPPPVVNCRRARSRSPSFALRQVPPPPPPPGYAGHPKSDGHPAPPPSMRGKPMPPPPQQYPVGMGPGPHHPPRPQNPPFPPTQPLASYRVPADRAAYNHLPPMPSYIAGAGSYVRNNSSTTRHPHPLALRQPFTLPPPPQILCGVRLVIEWEGYGQHRILTSVVPTIQALKNTAIADVRQHPQSFMSTKKSPSPWNGNSCPPGLIALVRKCEFGDETYDLQGFHSQDLSALFEMAAGEGLLTFEIVVKNVPLNEDEDEASVQELPGSRKVTEGSH